MKTFATLLAFAAMTMATSLSAQTKTETSADDLYTVDIPQEWVSDSASKSLFNIMSISTLDGAAMIINATKTPLPLKQAYKTLVEAVSKNKDYSGYSVIGEGDSSVGGQECKWICCSYTAEGQAMKAKQYALRNGKRLYYIQYHLSADIFDEYSAQFDQVIGTISFK